MTLEIKDLHVRIEGKEIVKGLSLAIGPGELHALMGPNGSGKSTLAHVLMGHPKYEVTSGSIVLDGEDIMLLSPDERARKGLFLSFQYPVEIPGVTIESFLRAAVNGVRGTDHDVREFHDILLLQLRAFGIEEDFAKRYVNAGFSGGEKKRMEILQLLMLDPKYSVLDETDSGLDVDALRVVASGINKVRDGKHGILIITHYNRILQHVVPDKVHVMVDGKIVRSGGKQLAHEIEEKGYELAKN
jgi:Fe-S cluster assembly ATP-binding protein